MTVILSVTLLAVIAFASAWLLRIGGQHRDERSRSAVERINDLLPQTQCGRCGYAGCRPYAEAIARHEARINQCPPGGDATILNLAELLGEDVLPLNPRHGREQPPQVVVIDEAVCIGCTKCIQACPVDAIVGAPTLMHTVIASRCTGCELCIPPCPVDCIAVAPLAMTMSHWKWPPPKLALP